MALYLPARSSAYINLKAHGFDVRDANDAPSHGAVVHLAFVNIMPNKWIAEDQTFRLLAQANRDVVVSLVVPNGYTSSTCPEYTEKHYKQFGEATRENNFDALILNGAPVEHLPFEQVSYIHGLREVLDYAKTEVKASAYICFGAYAALDHFYGVPKIVNDNVVIGGKTERAKFFGLYEHEIGHTYSKFAREVAARLERLGKLKVPVSRSCTVDGKLLRRAATQLEIILDNKETGPGVLYDAGHHRLIVTPHPEYCGKSLQQEYRRDVEKNPAFPAPLGYEKGPPEGKVPPWAAIANALFVPWVEAMPMRDLAPTPTMAHRRAALDPALLRVAAAG